MGAQMNSPACCAMRGDRTVAGTDWGECIRKDLPWDGINENTRLIPEAASFAEIWRTSKLSRCGVAKDGPCKAKTVDIRGYSRAECSKKPPANSGSLKKAIGKNVWLRVFQKRRSATTS